MIVALSLKNAPQRKIDNDMKVGVGELEEGCYYIGD